MKKNRFINTYISYGQQLMAEPFLFIILCAIYDKCIIS